MPKSRKTLIMKFGGGALLESESFHRVAQLILKRQGFDRLVVVLSAMRGVTNRLIKLAYQLNPNPPRREYDMLVSVGERISISLLAMALDAEGREAVSFTGSQSGVITTSDHSDAKIITVRPYRLKEALDRGQIVIVAGFQGVSETKEITTLGRGGSDTTAVALGIALEAEKIEFYKDVQGICNADPSKVEKTSVFTHLTHAQAHKIVMQTGGKVVHPRAIALAEKNQMPLHLLPFWGEQAEGTRIETPKTQQSEGEVYEAPNLASVV